MTKKDYVLIAKTINKNIEWSEELHGRDINPHLLIEDLQNALKKDNPKFDIEKFKYLCFQAK